MKWIKSKLFQWLRKDKTIIEQIGREEWLAANRVPKKLWQFAVSASDDFLVLREPNDFRYHRIYPRRECGEIDDRFKFKEFYVSWGVIRSPKDFPPEKIKEKWEEWPYPNEISDLENET